MDNVIKAIDGVFRIPVPRDQVIQIVVADVDLVLVLRDGIKIVLANAAIEAMDARPPVLKFAGSAEVSSANLLVEVDKVKPSKYAVAPVSSGEEHKFKARAGGGTGRIGG